MDEWILLSEIEITTIDAFLAIFFRFSDWMIKLTFFNCRSFC